MMLVYSFVKELRAVLADGKIVVANPVSYPDLFWAACGGGGGNFAVFTFQIQTHCILW